MFFHLPLQPSKIPMQFLFFYPSTRTISAILTRTTILKSRAPISAREQALTVTQQLIQTAGITTTSKKFKHKQPITSALNTNSSRPYTTTLATMADDASYSAFLSRANQDPRSGHAQEGESTSQARSKFDPSSTTSTNEAIPASLRCINATYTSDTDSDFEPVFFSYGSSELPSTEQFERVLGAKAQNAGKVEEISVKEFDPRGEYSDVIGKVEQAGKTGGVKVFRVEVDGRGTRVEYYVLTVGERSLVGVVAKAVES